MIELRPYKRYLLFVMNETAPLKFMLTITSLKFVKVPYIFYNI